MDVSPAKRSYFTCANVWWKLLFHSTRICEALILWASQGFFNQNLALGLGKFYKMKKLPRNPSHCRSSIIQRIYQPPVLVNLYGLPGNTKNPNK